MYCKKKKMRQGKTCYEQLVLETMTCGLSQGMGCESPVVGHYVALKTGGLPNYPLVNRLAPKLFPCPPPQERKRKKKVVHNRFNVTRTNNLLSCSPLFKPQSKYEELKDELYCS